MQIERLLGTAAAFLVLTAASCPPQPELSCITFGPYAHNQIMQTPVEISGWRITAMPLPGSANYPSSFRFYDPAGDGGPADHKGPEVYGEFQLTPSPGKRTYSELTVEYVNDSTFPPEIRLLDATSTQLAFQSFAATPQNSALVASMKAQGFAHIHIKGGELIIGKVCVR